MRDSVNVICSTMGLVIIAVLFLLALRSEFIRCKHTIETWAEENGYKIIKREYKTVVNVFGFLPLGGQDVHHITVVDKDGNTKSGFVHCGDWLFGFDVNKVYVKWDK